jgi:hypothetical protein
VRLRPPTILSPTSTRWRSARIWIIRSWDSPRKSAAGTPEWADPAPRASPALPGVSTHHRGDLCRGRSRCRHRGRAGLSRGPMLASRPAHRRPDKRMGSPQSAVVLPRPISIIASRSTIQRTFDIGRLSDHAGRADPSPACDSTPPNAVHSVDGVVGCHLTWEVQPTTSNLRSSE